MVTELDLQTKMIAALKEAGGWGYKTDHKHMSGLPDLELMHPSTGVVKIEVKITGPSGIILLSPIQVHTLSKMKACGAKVGVAAVLQVSAGKYIIYSSPDCTLTRVKEGIHRIHIKNVGEPWPILEIMRHCAS